MTEPLRADLRVEPSSTERPEELVATADVRADVAVSVDLVPLRSPSLALELRDESGRPAPLPPPPVPGGAREVVELLPGGPRRVEWPGFVPSWFEPGRYEVRVAYRAGELELTSDWVAFEIVR
ncbi:MAG TPA: hypothetical protein VHJ76_08670 [Actinomycetota bacterium]|nr:hypothetical protein [Actinomycetota bacterium]